MQPNMKADVHLTGRRHLPFFVHILNLIVQHTLDQDEELSKLCRTKIVMF